MDFFEGKVIAITGAASGMGLATAKLLAKRGALLSIADLNEARLDAALASLPPPKDPNKSHIRAVIDVSSTEAVDSWIKSTIDAFGRLDGAANIAGIGRHVYNIRETTDEAWEEVMNTNAKGVFKCMRAEVKAMTEGGSIVNMASVAAFLGLPSLVAYTSSKHAVLGMTRSAANDEGPRGIRINCIAPGATDTPMLAGFENVVDQVVASQIIKRLTRPEEIANAVAFLLSDQASMITGICLPVDGGQA